MLDKINCPNDIKVLSIQEMEDLAQEMRDAIITRVNTVGGHLGPDLCFVEPTIALHYVFNSPSDKFVFDVSHQTYPHKMLTGRKEAFTNPLEHPEISGYSNPNESEHDNFIIGHTSTSVSLATGLAKARDLKGETYNVIAIIGDGSLSGGEAFEGINNAAVLNSNFIIVVNDNEMSIAENQGGLYNNLRILRETNGKSENNIFKSFGYDYYYLENGNNLEELIDVFKLVKDTQKPTVVHIHTLKGKGYKPAEIDKEAYHWIMPNFLNSTGQEQLCENYYTLTTDYILKNKDKNIVAITAATPGATSLTKEFRKLMGKNYTDVGIAEEHAIAYSSGLAKNGAKPVFFVLSSFLQRTYDQLSQDLALNNSPATILVCWGGISSADVTHLQVFDIPLISNIPNMVYLAPTNKEEYLQMLDWSINQTKFPTAIRMPSNELISTGIKDETDYSILNKYKIEENGEQVAIFGVGNFMPLAKEVKKALNLNATIINPKFLTGLDTELLERLKINHKIVVTLEDGVLDGGFGEKIARYYGNSDMKVLNYGAKKEFTDRISLDELYTRYRLKPELIIQDVQKLL